VKFAESDMAQISCNISSCCLFISSLWLYVNECCCIGFSETYINGSVYSSSQLASTQRSLVEQPLEQPNIDLQVTLTQRWPGLNALLIDVAPYCLLVNECDLELTFVEESGGSWRLPAGKTFSPPFFNEVSFLLCIISYVIVTALSGVGLA